MSLGDATYFSTLGLFVTGRLLNSLRILLPDKNTQEFFGLRSGAHLTFFLPSRLRRSTKASRLAITDRLEQNSSIMAGLSNLERDPRRSRVPQEVPVKPGIRWRGLLASSIFRYFPSVARSYTGYIGARTHQYCRASCIRRYT